MDSRQMAASDGTKAHRHTGCAQHGADLSSQRARAYTRSGLNMVCLCQPQLECSPHSGMLKGGTRWHL